MLAIIAAIENDIEREFITQIYLEFYKKMRAKAFFIVHNDSEADEIVQEAFVKLIEHVREIMKLDPVKVPVYVMVTVKNISLNHWHDARKEQECKVLVADDELERWTSDEKALPEDIYIHEEESGLWRTRFRSFRRETEDCLNPNISSAFPIRI